MKKCLTLIAALIFLCSSLSAFAEENKTLLSEERLRTLATVQKLSGYDDGLNLYTMEVFMITISIISHRPAILPIRKWCRLF